jgi:serine/threonine protein kinase
MGEDLPREFGPYTLHELINRGGMAEIYRATMPGIGDFEKTVAIKKILPHKAEDDEFVSMLIDEARIIESLDHSNIAQVYDLGELEDRYYIAMEYVHGVDLDDVVAELSAHDAHMPLPHVVHVLSRVCAGLHYAHSKTDDDGTPLEIVHRDVSLHNVLVSLSGEVKLIDFGVAQADERRAKTQTGVVKGKLLYMSPEQARADELDGRADLFSAGLCAYKMLTGFLPFEGDNEFQVYDNVLSKEITPPAEIRPEIPNELDRIVMKLLRRDRGARYQEGYAVKEDLEPLLHELAPGYTANRLSRFVEERLSHLLRGGAKMEASGERERSEAAGEASSDLAPETPAPRAPETGRQGAVESGGGGDEVGARHEADSADRASVRAEERGPEADSRDDTPRGEGAAGPDGVDAPRTSTPGGDTPVSRRVDALDEEDGRGAKNDGGGRRRPIVWGIALLVLSITGMVGYGLYSGAWTGDASRAHAGGASSGSGAPPEADTTIRISLASDPSGARLVRRGTAIGRTPIAFSLPKSDSSIDLTLRKPGYRDRTFQVVPNRDLEETLALATLGDASSPTASTDVGGALDTGVGAKPHAPR